MRLTLPVLIGCAALSVAWQDPEVAAPRGIDPERFQKLDLEHRWILYRQSVTKHAADSASWVAFLEARRDFALLEQLAIYEGYMQLFQKGKPGEVLHRNDAPQWMRVALWNIKQRDSHNSVAAQSPLAANAPRFVGWARKFPEVKRLGGKQLLEQFQNVVPVDPGDQLPPLDPQTVILPYLDAPKKLPDLGPDEKLDRTKRYRFQVLRAIRAISIAGTFDEPYRSKLLRLIRHRDPEVRQTAILEFSEFPTQKVPWSELVVLARMQQVADADRSAAILAASYSNHPAAYLAVREVLADPQHPGFPAVLSRLQAIADGYTLNVLNAVPRRGMPEALRSRVAATVKIVQQRVNMFASSNSGEPAMTILLRAAHAVIEEDPQAPTLLDWTRKHIALRTLKPAFVTQLRQLVANPGAAAIPEHLQEWVRKEAQRILKSQ